MDSVEKAEEFWRQQDFAKSHDVAWSAVGHFEEKYRRRMTGSGDLAGYLWGLLESRIPAAERNDLAGCALVCGSFESESNYFEHASGVRFTEVHGYDLIESLVTSYQPRDPGVVFHPHVEDVNDLVLAKEELFHLIIGNHGIHHVMNVGNLFFQANRALTPNGLFFMYEWIGPRYLQIPWPNRVVAACLLYLLFRPRSRTNHEGKRRGWWVQYPAEFFDPSEACNSTAIWEAYTSHFHPIRSIFFGGLTYPIYEGCGYLYDEGSWDRSWRHRTRVRIVYYLEKWLTAIGLVKPLFVITVGQKKPLWDQTKPTSWFRRVFGRSA